MHITCEHPLLGTRMVSVLLDGTNIDELRVCWVDVEAGKVGVRRKSPDAFLAVDRNFGPKVLELTGDVRFVWSEYAQEMSDDLRRRLAELYPEVSGLCPPMLEEGDRYE